MTTAPQLFEFDTNQIRVIMSEDATPLFAAKDVAEALGYVDTVNAVKRHCKGVAKRHPLSTDGGEQLIRVIDEPDVYRLVMGSRLPSAERFERWVFEEVLPTIRRTGRYAFQPPPQPARPELPRVIGPLVFEPFEGVLRLRDEQLVKLVGFHSVSTLRHTIRTRIDRGFFEDGEVFVQKVPRPNHRRGIPPRYYLFSHRGAQRFLGSLRSQKGRDLGMLVAEACARRGQAAAPPLPPSTPTPLTTLNEHTRKMLEEAPIHAKACMAAALALGMDESTAQKRCAEYVNEVTGQKMFAA